MYDELGNHIATHVRQHSGKQYVTAMEHMRENYREIVEFDGHDGNRQIIWQSPF